MSNSSELVVAEEQGWSLGCLFAPAFGTLVSKANLVLAK